MKPPRERRQNEDRRTADAPLRGRERRRLAERRSILIEEIPFEEWVAKATEYVEQQPVSERPAVSLNGRRKPSGGRFFRMRAEQDRRQYAAGPPPGRKERRLLADRRGLMVREISYSEFLRLLRGRR